MQETDFTNHNFVPSIQGVRNSRVLMGDLDHYGHCAIECF